MAIKNHSASKKISELNAWISVPNKKDNAWIPIAYYDDRVNSYTNVSLNVNAITSYSINTAVNIATTYTYTNVSNITDKINILEENVNANLDLSNDFNNIKNEWTNFSEAASTNVNNNNIAASLVTYSVAKTMENFDWLQLNGGQMWLTV